METGALSVRPIMDLTISMVLKQFAKLIVPSGIEFNSRQIRQQED